MQFFYERLDSLALMEAERWLDLDSDQAQRLRRRIDERLERHRSEELPRYADVLELAARHVEQGASAAELDATFATVQELLHEGLQHSVPVLAQAFDELDAAQVEHFAGELRASNEDYSEEYLEPPPERRRADRLEAPAADRRDVQMRVPLEKGRDHPRRLLVAGMLTRHDEHVHTAAGGRREMDGRVGGGGHRPRP